MQKNKIEIIDSDDWVEIKVDDDIVFENHSFNAKNLYILLTDMGVKVTYTYKEDYE